MEEKLAAVLRVNDCFHASWDDTRRLLVGLSDEQGTQVSLDAGEGHWLIVEYVKNVAVIFVHRETWSEFASVGVGWRSYPHVPDPVFFWLYKGRGVRGPPINSPRLAPAVGNRGAFQPGAYPRSGPYHHRCEGDGYNTAKLVHRCHLRRFTKLQGPKVAKLRKSSRQVRVDFSDSRLGQDCGNSGEQS